MKLFLKIGTEIAAVYLERNYKSIIAGKFDLSSLPSFSQFLSSLPTFEEVCLFAPKKLESGHGFFNYPNASVAAIIGSEVTTGSSWDYFKIVATFNTLGNICYAASSGDMQKAVEWEVYELGRAAALASIFYAEEQIVDSII